MAIQQDRGNEGEILAVDFLVNKGYQIVAQNYRSGYGEIDIIAREGSCLVFVEVKSKTSVQFGHPEEAVDDRKARKVIGVAEAYVLENNWDGRIRFDVISILLGENPRITQFEDAFY